MDEIDVNELQEIYERHVELEPKNDIELSAEAWLALEREKEAAIKVLERVAEVVIDVWNQIKDAFMEFADAFCETLKVFSDVLSAYPNKHIVWLALHHRKGRVRKKNLHRILKYYEKENVL